MKQRASLLPRLSETPLPNEKVCQVQVSRNFAENNTKKEQGKVVVHWVIGELGFLQVNPSFRSEAKCVPKKSVRWGLNPRSPAPEAGAFPLGHERFTS